MGPVLQTRVYSDPVTRVSLALNWGQCRGLGLSSLHPRLLLPGFGRSRTPLSQLTPREPPLIRTHTLWRARTHFGHSHSASRDTRPRTCPPFTHAHARVHTQTHTASRPLLHSIRPPLAAPQRHSLTVTHLHPFTDTHTPPTHASHRHTFINRARSIHAPLRLLFREP